jgi:hypothetical protein
MTIRLLAVAVLAGAATTVFAGLSSNFLRGTPAAASLTPAGITGDYVEARTASVFCGACHYNGELVTTGNDALMAWSFDGGTYRGVSLKGVRAMACVTCDENLSLNRSPHRAQLAVDTAATEAQVAAVRDLIQEKCGGQIGSIVSVSRTPIAFAHSDAGYLVTAPSFGTLHVSYRTDNSCCVQPGLVWYEPLAPITGRKVGYTELAQSTAAVSPPWERIGEDSAFYGAIAF